MIATIILINVIMLGVIWTGGKIISRLKLETNKLVGIRLIFRDTCRNRGHHRRGPDNTRIRRHNLRPPSRRRSTVLEGLHVNTEEPPPNYNETEEGISDMVRLLAKMK